MMKNLLQRQTILWLSISLFFGTVVTVSAQSTPVVTKIAVVDVQLVYNETNKSSPAMVKLEAMKTRMEEDIKKKQEAIATLKEQRVEANNNNEKAKVSTLDRSIKQKEADLVQFHTNSQRQLDQAQANISIDNDFKELILKATIDVADRNGYSVVLAKNSTLLYWSRQVDISGAVIDQVNRMLEQQSAD